MKITQKTVTATMILCLSLTSLSGVGFSGLQGTSLPDTAPAFRVLQQRELLLSTEAGELAWEQNRLREMRTTLRLEEGRVEFLMAQLIEKERKLSGDKPAERKSIEVEKRMLRYREETLAATEEKLKNLQGDIESALEENRKIKEDIEQMNNSISERELNLKREREAVEKEKRDLEERRLELMKIEEDLRKKEKDLAERERLLSLKKEGKLDKKDPLIKDKEAGDKTDASKIAEEKKREAGRIALEKKLKKEEDKKKRDRSAEEVIDLDGDGIPDGWLRYDAEGRLISEEFLTRNADKTGRVKAEYSKEGEECPVRVTGDSTGDGKTDFWAYYENCFENRRELDTNGDGRVNEWVYYKRFDEQTVCIDRIEKDLTGNGKINYWATYVNCLPDRQEYDMNENGIHEIVRSVKPGNLWIRRLGTDAKLKAEDHFNKQEFEDAEVWFNKAIDEFKLEFGSSDPEMNAEIADCYLRLGSIHYGKDNAAARAYYLSVPSVGNPEQRGTAYVNIANSYYNEKDFESAAENYANAVRAQPLDGRSLRLYTESVIRQAGSEKKEEKRAAVLRDGRKLFNELDAAWAKEAPSVRANAYWLKGILLNEGGYFADAEAALKIATDLNPESVDMLVSYSWAQFCQGKLDMAIATVNKALLLKNDDLNTLWNLSLYLHIKGDKPLSEKYLTQAVTVNRAIIRRVYGTEIAKAMTLLPAYRSSLETYKSIVATKTEQK